MYLSCMRDLLFSVGHPIIRFASGLEETIGPEKWSVRSGAGAFMVRRQLPLKLAWAISIHKSQVSTAIVNTNQLVQIFLRKCKKQNGTTEWYHL